MAFGARNDDGWRLCHRKGRSIKTIYAGQIPVIFTSQAKAKACADELNEAFWKPYWKTEKKDEDPVPDVFWGMIGIIAKHGGLSADQVKEIENAS